MKAQEALEIGLADRIFDGDDFEEEALKFVRQLASGASVAMSLAKQAVDSGLETTLAVGLDIEAAAFTDLFSTEDAQHGVASFLENGPGKAKFVGK